MEKTELASLISRAGIEPPLHLANSPKEGLLSETGWPIHGFAIVLGAPAGAVDVDVVGVQAQRTSLYRVSHLAIQHAHPWPQRGWEKGCHVGPAARGTHRHRPSLNPREEQERGEASAGKPKAPISCLPLPFTNTTQRGQRVRPSPQDYTFFTRKSLGPQRSKGSKVVLSKGDAG